MNTRNTAVCCLRVVCCCLYKTRPVCHCMCPSARCKVSGLCVWLRPAMTADLQCPAIAGGRRVWRGDRRCRASRRGSGAGGVAAGAAALQPSARTIPLQVSLTPMTILTQTLRSHFPMFCFSPFARDSSEDPLSTWKVSIESRCC